MPSDLTVHRERRSGLRPLHSVGDRLFVESDQGRPVEIQLFVAANGTVTARRKGDAGVDQALSPQRTIIDRLSTASIDQV